MLSGIILSVVLIIDIFSFIDPFTELSITVDGVLQKGILPILVPLLLIQILIAYAFVNVVTKRFHDFDWRGHSAALPLIPLLLMALPESNVPVSMRIGFYCLTMLFSLVALCWIIIQCMSQGSKGENRFGHPFGTVIQEHENSEPNKNMEKYIAQLISRGYQESQVRSHVEAHSEHFEESPE